VLTAEDRTSVTSQAWALALEPTGFEQAVEACWLSLASRFPCPCYPPL